MIADAHYDLLTIIYLAIKNDCLESLKHHCRQIYGTQIKGGMLALYFTNSELMRTELGIKRREIKPLKMLTMVDKVIKEHDLLPTPDHFLYAIEGMDYIKLQELEKLYKLGVRVIAPVWNNQNRYGSGIYSTQGLTAEGTKLIHKLIDLRVVIDLSHANEATFWDIIGIAKTALKNGKKPLIIASHSNCYALTAHPRNLKDEQLLAIKALKGFIGLAAVPSFCEIKDLEIQDAYLEHFKHVKGLFGDTKNIMIAIDDCSFIDTRTIYNYEEIGIKMKQLLQKEFNLEEIADIASNNYFRLLKLIKAS